MAELKKGSRQTLGRVSQKKSKKRGPVTATGPLYVVENGGMFMHIVGPFKSRSAASRWRNKNGGIIHKLHSTKGN